MFAVLCILLIVTSLISIDGLKIEMNREYFYHGKNLFCAQLQCTENIREDTQISALVNMSVYRISEPEGKILVASISESDSKLQDHKRAGTRVEGKISKTLSELDIFLSNHSDCNGGIFLCEIHYVNTTGSFNRIGKQTGSLQRKSRESLIMMSLKAKTPDYVKSVDAMADFLKSFEDPDRLKGADMTMSLQMSHSGGDKFSTDKSFGQTELNNSFKQISSFTLDDMLDDKVKKLTAELNETLHQIENKTTNIIEKEFDKRMSSYIETHKLDQEKLSALNKSVQTITADSQKQTEQWNSKFSHMEEKLKKIVTQDNFNTTFNMMYDINRTMQILLDEYYYHTFLRCVSNYSSNLPERIIININESKNALCDTKTDGGGWVIIQRRVKGDVNFTRTWDDYKKGFGSMDGDYWLGNDWISNLTQNGYNELRFDMKYRGESYYAVCSNVTVGNEADLYRIKLKFKTGNVKERFSDFNGMAFSTLDRDNDGGSRNCAEKYKGGWWYKDDCHVMSLNGVWVSKGVNREGIIWYDITEHVDSPLDQTEMKLRRP